MSGTDEVERAIVDRVTREGPTWFPGSPARPPVSLRTLSTGRRSRVYAVSVGAPTASRVLVAKVRHRHTATRGSRGGPRRPLLAPVAVDEEELAEREYAGLRLLAATFDGADGRFGAIRPLAHLAEHCTILMEYVPGETVRDLLVRSSRLHLPRLLRPGPALDRPLADVGHWLRTFQHAAPTASYPARQGTGREVVAHFRELEDYFGRRLGRGVSDLVGAGAALAEEVLPPGALPLAVGHGDFAPRNVLVDARGRVVVFDPLIRWAVPAQEDLCRFLVGIRMLGLQRHSHGAAFSRPTVDRWERLVIEGGGSVPMPELRCYELLILLDKWSALVEPGGSGGVRARARLLPQRLVTGYLREQAEEVLGSARSASG